jgi:hypothetical protein
MVDIRYLMNFQNIFICTYRYTLLMEVVTNLQGKPLGCDAEISLRYDADAFPRI